MDYNLEDIQGVLINKTPAGFYCDIVIEKAEWRHYVSWLHSVETCNLQELCMNINYIVLDELIRFFYKYHSSDLDSSLSNVQCVDFNHKTFGTITVPYQSEILIRKPWALSIDLIDKPVIRISDLTNDYCKFLFYLPHRRGICTAYKLPTKESVLDMVLEDGLL
jgi:hypothetical protein